MTTVDKFYKNLMIFLSELVDLHPEEGDLLLMRLYIETQNKDDIINKIGKFINDNINLINDESFKEDPNSLCNKLNQFTDSSKIMKLRNLWLFEGDENKNIIIKWLNVFNRIYVAHTKKKE